MDGWTHLMGLSSNRKEESQRETIDMIQSSVMQPFLFFILVLLIVLSYPTVIFFEKAFSNLIHPSPHHLFSSHHRSRDFSRIVDDMPPDLSEASRVASRYNRIRREAHHQKKTPSREEPFRVALLLAGPLNDLGWGSSHNLARQQLELMYNGTLTSRVFEWVPFFSLLFSVDCLFYIVY